LAAASQASYSAADRALFAEFRAALARGEVRAAERGPNGRWRANAWVKQGILLGFRMGAITEMADGPVLKFFDKDTYPLRPTTAADQVRIVPGGSSIRDGAYVAPGVVCMPPMFVNVGAYVDEGTMIDSHALVGSCAQSGKRARRRCTTWCAGRSTAPRTTSRSRSRPARWSSPGAVTWVASAARRGGCPCTRR